MKEVFTKRPNADNLIRRKPAFLGAIRAISRLQKGCKMRNKALAVAILLLAGLFANAAHAAVVLLNNGGSLITLNDATYSADDVYVRDATCGQLDFPYKPCLFTGGSTDINVATGAVVDNLFVLDTSTITMSDGTVNGWLAAADSGSISMSGGVVDGLLVDNSAYLEMSGGTVNLWFEAYENSITVMNGGLSDGLLLADNSLFTIHAGTVHYLDAQNASGVTMYGGTVGGGAVGDDLNAWDFSDVKLLGGNVTGYLNVGDYSTVTMVGGTVDLDFDSWFEANAVLSGGTVTGDIDAWDSSSFTWNGGTVAGEVFAGDTATLTIDGTDFQVDGVPVPMGDLSAMTGVLTGTLESGDPINNTFYQGGHDYYGDSSWFVTGTITLVPEPSMVLLQTVALLSLGAIATRRRAAGLAA